MSIHSPSPSFVPLFSLSSPSPLPFSLSTSSLLPLIPVQRYFFLFPSLSSISPSPSPFPSSAFLSRFALSSYTSRLSLFSLEVEQQKVLALEAKCVLLAKESLALQMGLPPSIAPLVRTCVRVCTHVLRKMTIDYGHFLYIVLFE